MKNDNFYKTLRIVCLILAIVCMALSLFKKAKAEGIPADVKEEFLSYYATNFTDNQLNEVSNLIDNSKYYCYVKDHRGTNGSTIYPCLILWNIDDIEFGCDYTNNFLNYIQFTSGDMGVQTRYSVSNFTIYVLKKDNYKGITATQFTYTNNVDKGNSYYLHYSPNRNAIFNDINQTGSNVASANTVPTTTSAGDRTNVEFIYTDEFKLYKRSGSSYQNLIFNQPITYFANTQEILPITNNTDNFEVYKYGASGSERLVCDFSNCISISNEVGNSSTIQIDITIDGVDQTFNFDSNSSYYDYSVPNHIAKYSFPLSTFGINNETISAKLTGVTIVNTTSSPGGSGSKNIVWVTPLTLVGSDYEDLEPEVIPKEQMPDFDKFDDEDTQTNYNSTINRWITSGSSSFDYSLYTRWNFEPKYYIVPVIYYGASQAAIDALKAALNLDFGQAIDDVIAIAQGITIEDQIQEFMQENYYLNDLYDIIVFAYEASAGADTIYYIFTTDSYNNHLSNSFLYDVLQVIYDDGKAIEKTYDYLYDRLDDFEDKTLTKLNEMVGLQEMENGFFSSLQSILNQILNALLNLNIEVPEADYTDIVDKLDTIIENQDTSDINDDWYQNYREWLYGINENDSYLSPHEYFNNIFGTLKTTFDSFTNNISFNAYLLKVEDFINHISGSTTDNLTIYLRDGIGDPGFNINNNYMYTVGGSQ